MKIIAEVLEKCADSEECLYDIEKELFQIVGMAIE